MNLFNTTQLPDQVIQTLASLPVDTLKAYLNTLSRNIEESDKTDGLFDTYWTLANVLRQRTKSL